MGNSRDLATVIAAAEEGSTKVQIAVGRIGRLVLDYCRARREQDHALEPKNAPLMQSAAKALDNAHHRGYDANDQYRRGQTPTPPPRSEDDSSPKSGPMNGPS